MKRKKILITIIIIAFFGQFSSQIKNLNSLVLKADPSIIKIYTLNQYNKEEAQGSGVIISSNGICISNYHVLVGAKNGIIYTSNGKKHKILKILDYSKAYDLIKFKIDIAPAQTSPANMNYTLPLKGSDVFAIGYPNGFTLAGESTVSTGIISSFREIEGEKYIQTTTPFTHGSSGGGLFDVNGKLIGITTGTFAGNLKDRHANINKVVPSELIKKLNRNLDLSLSDFFETIKEDELFVKAMIAYEEKEYEVAAEYFTQHLEQYPYNPVAWFRKGNCYNQLGRRGDKGNQADIELLNGALECFEISISLDTNYYYAYAQSALVHLTLNNVEEAKYYAFKACLIEPNQLFTNYVVGKVASGIGEYSTAIVYFSSAIKQSDEIEKKNQLHQLYLERAIAYSLLKNDDYSAEQDY
ncbi:MAG: tetratricopeptide repeat-containing serine protease family protein [Bacteroidota bacterium]|jgi:hypothetical protein